MKHICKLLKKYDFSHWEVNKTYSGNNLSINYKIKENYTLSCGMAIELLLKVIDHSYIKVKYNFC